MIDPRLSTTSKPPSRPSPFGRLWRIFLPVAIAVMAAAVLTGIGDATSRPAWLFAAGVFIALIGAVSFFAHLFDLGRSEMRDLEKKLEDKLDRHGNGRP